MPKDPISLHRKLGGKIFVGSKITPLKLDDIELIYTPGVAKVSQYIFHNPDQKYSLTSKGNNVAIVTDGTRILDSLHLKLLLRYLYLKSIRNFD